MIILIAFAFLAGIVTILSPCILPVLPIVLASGVGEGKRRPLGVVVGFVLSFTFFTLFLATIVRFTGISADFLRTASIIIILLFGISLLFSGTQVFMEKLFSKISSKVPTTNKSGFWGGVLVGLSLGLIWTPCVGPIIASVITLAVTSSVDVGIFLITLSYAIGTAIPMLLIMFGGRALILRVPGLLSNSKKIQKIFGILLILVALMLYFNLDRKFQIYLLEKFPQYGIGLTQIENNPLVKEQLKNINGTTQVGVTDSKTLQENMLYKAPEFIPGGEWFNTADGKPVTLASLKGKVVLVDFWTYTCINCIRTLPYLRDWNEKYKDKGLVIVGVHTPEFEFEKNPQNVKKAITDFGIEYPVVQDNDYATWKAYKNNYWPAKYFIDKNGVVRATHFGEGEYDQSEKIIQDLLSEAGEDVSNIKIKNPTYQLSSQTPETYLGYQRMAGLVSPEAVVPNSQIKFTLPKELLPNTFAFDGVWGIGEERSVASAGAKLFFNFGAKNVYLVMRTNDGKVGKVKVYLNDKFVKEVEVKEDKLYELIKLPEAGRNLLELEFVTPNIESYAFTFG